MNTKLDDRMKSTVVEILADETGKVWVNVDGVCILRIGTVKTLIIDNKRDDVKEGYRHGRND